MDGAERVAKRQRGDDGERDATRRRNAAHRELVAARLREQLDPHRLRVALDELGSIVSDADAACVEFSMFEALDELMAQMEHDTDLGAVISVDGGESEGCGSAYAVLTLVGRYCALWERPALALGHFRAAVEACTSSPEADSPDAAAARQGATRCTSLLRWRDRALSSCVRWWTAPHTAPPYLCESGLQAFRSMNTRPCDVIMASYPKCGTSWLHQILFSLLRMDAAGQFAAPEQTLLGSSGQIYPDSMPARRIGNEVVDSARDHYRNFGFASTGRWCFEDMLDQPAPRLFSTHARAQNLPASLTSRGRLIVISRNPKDAIVSAHFFSRKLAAQGGLGEAGADAVAGSMQSTCDAWNATHSEEPEHGAYGDYYTWHQEQAALMSQIGEERATITFYETLQDDFDNEVRRLADFLGILLPTEKLNALKQRVAFDAMAERGCMMTRKGRVRDFENHMSSECCVAVDNAFRSKLGDVKALAPLRKYVGM